MKLLSRHLPPIAREKTPWFAWIFGSGTLGLYLFLLGCLVLNWPYFGLSVLGVFLALIFRETLRAKRRLDQLREERRDLSICDFAKELNPREIDPWIIRTTYQEMGACLGSVKAPLPVKASDHLEKDLEIDSEDLEEMLGAIAVRSGRSLERTRENPFYDRVFTVRDLAHFLNAQPKRAGSII